jgi:hypothetical protein
MEHSATKYTLAQKTNPTVNGLDFRATNNKFGPRFDIDDDYQLVENGIFNFADGDECTFVNCVFSSSLKLTFTGKNKVAFDNCIFSVDLEIDGNDFGQIAILDCKCTSVNIKATNIDRVKVFNTQVEDIEVACDKIEWAEFWKCEIHNLTLVEVLYTQTIKLNHIRVENLTICDETHRPQYGLFSLDSTIINGGFSYESGETISSAQMDTLSILNSELRYMDMTVTTDRLIIDRSRLNYVDLNWVNASELRVYDSYLSNINAKNCSFGKGIIHQTILANSHWTYVSDVNVAYEKVTRINVTNGANNTVTAFEVINR